MNVYILMTVFGGVMTLSFMIAVIAALEKKHRKLAVLYAVLGTITLLVFSIGMAGIN